MTEKTSHKKILKSSAIIAAASVVNILVGLIKMKVVAVLLGPTGVGLVGLLANLMQVGASFSSFGVGDSGTREIANSCEHGSPEDIAAVRRALFLTSLILSVIGTLIFLLASEFLAKQFLSDADKASYVRWLAVGVLAIVLSGSQKALITGYRYVSYIAKITVFSSVLSAAVGVAVVYRWGGDAIVVLVVSVPLSSLIASSYYCYRLPRPGPVKLSISKIKTKVIALIELGGAFMASGLSVALGLLIARSIIERKLGSENLGYFQAAWSISMTYLGFVLAAMGTDYFPRLTGVIGNPFLARKEVNDQAEVTMLLAGPVLIAMLVLAPWIIKALYTEEFLLASNVLRWQVLGDVLKIICWPIGFVIVASGKGKTFMVKEILIMIVFLLCVWAFTPVLGLEATGISFFVMYAVNLPLVMLLAKGLIGFKWARVVKKEIIILVVSSFGIVIVLNFSEFSGTVLGMGVLIALSIRNSVKLYGMANLKGPVGLLVSRCHQFLGRVW